MSSIDNKDSSIDIFSENISDDNSYSWKIHSCSQKSMLRTFKLIFPDIKKIDDSIDKLNIVILFQKTDHSMDSFSDEVEEERMNKTEKFIKWSEPIYDKIKQIGYWCDIIDPSSGLPYYGSRGNTQFIETDDVIMKLGYEILDFGCCKAIYHKKWGTFSFLSSLFTLCPYDQLYNIIKDSFDSF